MQPKILPFPILTPTTRTYDIRQGAATAYRPPLQLLYQISYQASALSSLRRRIISIALLGIRVPGPKIAATPAL